MISPLDLSPWLTRIRAECPAFEVVGLSSDMPQAERQLVRPRQAFVFVPTFRNDSGAGRGHATGRVRQSLLWTVPVVCAATHYGAPLDAQAEVDTLRGELWTALVGWTPYADTVGGAVRLDRGGPLAQREGVHWIEDLFSIRTQITE